MAAITTLEEKFLHELGDIYDAEHRFLDAQREMLGQASDAKLKSMLKGHIAQTEGQIGRLEQAYQLLGAKAKRVKCQAAVGLVNEAKKTMEDAAEAPAILDCVMAASQAKVEHYEIASYRCLVAGAELAGQAEVLELLRQNLDEEEQTAQRVEENTPALLKKAGKPARARKAQGPAARS